jgi:hypothetical protein
VGDVEADRRRKHFDSVIGVLVFKVMSNPYVVKIGMINSSVG